MKSCQSGPYLIQLIGELAEYEVSLHAEHIEEGLDQIHLHIRREEAWTPPELQLVWTHPVRDIAGYWHPGAGRNRGLQVDWGEGNTSRGTSSAPVGCLFSGSGHNRLTFAWSDALNPVRFLAGVHEETAELHCSVTLFLEAAYPITHYRASLLLDTRNVHYTDSLHYMQDWWQQQSGYSPAAVPAAAKLPMYSTWYSFHQQVSPEEIEEQCRMAKELGFGAVIVDDGWQTEDGSRGYAYCGDWEASSAKMPDMAAHVNRVQAMGMSYLLWYSVPFIGYRSKAWQRLQDKLLYRMDSMGAGVLDPRYPEVREYLTGIYEKAVAEWGLDGLKLDFVDNFRLPPGDNMVNGHLTTPSNLPDGWDTPSIQEGAHRLLSDVTRQLQKQKPDILIEFRQPYMGPLMRKYGNIFRAADCPNDAVENRIRILDLRLLAGSTAVHSDMLMWHPEETAEQAALQIINVLFAVPQLSVRLDRLPERHMAMVRYWMGFWLQHRDILLDGRLHPRHPELLYPVVEASLQAKRLTVVYQADAIAVETPADTGNESSAHRETNKEWIIVNGTSQNKVVVELLQAWGTARVTISDCTGVEVQQQIQSLSPGLHSLIVPPSGTVHIQMEPTEGR
jgi:alpha-galactosidase